MSRGNRGKSSPFRYILAPEGESPRSVECARSIQNLPRAKRAAGEWAGDVGAKGTLGIEERVDLPSAPWFSWKSVAVADVVNSAIQGWR